VVLSGVDRGRDTPPDREWERERPPVGTHVQCFFSATRQRLLALHWMQDRRLSDTADQQQISETKNWAQIKDRYFYHFKSKEQNRSIIRLRAGILRLRLFPVFSWPAGTLNNSSDNNLAESFLHDGSCTAGDHAAPVSWQRPVIQDVCQQWRQWVGTDSVPQHTPGGQTAVMRAELSVQPVHRHSQVWTTSETQWQPWSNGWWTVWVK